MPLWDTAMPWPGTVDEKMRSKDHACFATLQSHRESAYSRKQEVPIHGGHC